MSGEEIAIAVGLAAVIWTGGILLLGMWLGYDRGWDHATEEQEWQHVDKEVRRVTSGQHRRPKTEPEPEPEPGERLTSGANELVVAARPIEPRPVGDAERSLLLATVRGEYRPEQVPGPGTPIWVPPREDDPSVTAWTRDQAAELDQLIKKWADDADAYVAALEANR